MKTLSFRNRMRMLTTPVWIVLLLSAVSAMASPRAEAGAPGEAVRVFEPTGTVPGRWGAAAVADTVFEGVRYVSTQFLEGIFGQTGIWIPDRQKFVIADTSGRKWFFTLDNPYITIGDAVYHLGFPVRRGPEYLYLPLNPLLRILNGRMGYAAKPPSESRAVAAAMRADAAETSAAEKSRVESASPAANGKVSPASAEPEKTDANILGAEVEDRDNGTMVSVRVTEKLEWESFWVPPHFILKLQRGRLAPDFPSKATGQGEVKSIQAIQEDGLAQLTVTIPKPVKTVELAYDEESSKILITVRKEVPPNKPNVPAEKPKVGKGTGVIIIDPGHGGKDPGAKVAGVEEAQITLAVGLELRDALVKMGYKALMTRETDEFITLPDRPKFASSHNGDLFISLHCNSLGGSSERKKAVTGFVAYILREGESEEDKALARRENQAVNEESGKAGKSEIPAVEWILLEHQLNLYSKESENFVEKIVEEFKGFSIEKHETGASQAGFYVLVGAYMPAVLFEMGYLTHEQDRRVLNSAGGREKIAERLARAIDKFMLTKK